MNIGLISLKAINNNKGGANEENFIFTATQICVSSATFEKVVYDFTHESIDVVIPCHEKDLLTLDLSIESIKKFGSNINRIIVISEKKLTDNAEWFDEALFPFSKYDVALEIFHGDREKAEKFLNKPGSRAGWLFKQLMCFYAPFVVPGISSNVLMLDADTIFLKPVTFQDERGAPLFNIGKEYNKAYFVHAEKVIPGFKKVFPEYSGITHHMLFQRAILEDLFSIISQNHRTEAWKAICYYIDPEEFSGLSEYEIYFNFAFMRSNQPKIRPLNFINTSRLDLAHKFCEQGYHYISCHHYLRNKNAKKARSENDVHIFVD